METTRFILLIALGLVLTMIWQQWQKDYPAVVTVQSVGVSPALPANALDSSLPKPHTAKLNDNVASALTKNVIAKGNIIHVKTDVLEIAINTVGATVQYAKLLKYSISKEDQHDKVVLLDKEKDGFYLMQGGLLSKSVSINHKTVFHSENDHYQLAGKESLSVPLIWESKQGLRVVKTFTFYKGQYIADVRYDVQNHSSSDWVGSAYAQLNRTKPKKKGPRFVYTYVGAVLSTPEKRYEKIKFKEIAGDEKLSIDAENSWAAMVQHYFFAALIPADKAQKYHYYTLNPDKRSYVIGAITPSKTIAAGQSDNITQRFYVGPKLQKELPQYADGLELTVDYGIFWFLAEPVFWLLDHIHSVVKNWGWSIVLVTLFLKLLFFKLSAAGYRSMANMRKVQPRLLAMKERYKDDRAQLNQAMMALYKEEKINPLGGCLPILIQIPVFISLYWVLLESVELRQADFLWIHDLSAPDPYFILPLLMGITMFVQQKLNPTPIDPIQAKVMSVLPVAFTVFFAFFPAGLVLYWVANNSLSIAQQWVITRKIERTSPA